MRKRSLILLLSALCLLSFCGKKGNPVPKRIIEPLKIEDLRGEVKDGVLFLSFSLPNIGLDGFRVLRACGTCGAEFEFIKEISLQEGKGYRIVNRRLYFYDEGLLKGFLYRYKVIPIRKGIYGPSSNIFSITWKNPPDPPPKIHVKTDDRFVQLEWEAVEGLYYNVYRFDDGYPLFPLNAQAIKGSTFVDRNVVNGKTYIYEVRSVKRDGEDFEGKGKRIEATPLDRTPPFMPQGLSGRKVEGGVELWWNKNLDPDILGYNVYRQEGQEVRRLNKEPLKEERFFDKGIPSDKKYISYFVTAVDLSYNESEPSREIIIFLEE